jgi:hypothetical protein
VQGGRGAQHRPESRRSFLPLPPCRPCVYWWCEGTSRFNDFHKILTRPESRGIFPRLRSKAASGALARPVDLAGGARPPRPRSRGCIRHGFRSWSLPSFGRWLHRLMQPCPSARPGVARGRAPAGEGDHPPAGPRLRVCTSAARKTGETPAGGGPKPAHPSAREGPEPLRNGGHLAASKANRKAVCLVPPAATPPRVKGWKPERAETLSRLRARQPGPEGGRPQRNGKCRG